MWLLFFSYISDVLSELFFSPLPLGFDQRLRCHSTVLEKGGVTLAMSLPRTIWFLACDALKPGKKKSRLVVLRSRAHGISETGNPFFFLTRSLVLVPMILYGAGC